MSTTNIAPLRNPHLPFDTWQVGWFQITCRRSDVADPTQNDYLIHECLKQFGPGKLVISGGVLLWKALQASPESTSG